MRKFHLVVIITFFLAFSLPLIFVNRETGRIDKEENRYLAEFPTIIDTGFRFLPGIRDNIESWINDNAGGRSSAVMVKKILYYRLFNQYPDPKILIGRDNWMYIIYDRTWEYYLDTKPIPNKQIQKYRNHLKTISQILKDQDIEFSVVLWPYKHEIYPENIIGYQPSLRFEPVISQLDRDLSDNGSFDFSTPYKALLDAKKTNLVYSRVGDRYHWNNAGAFIGYTHLMDRIKRHLPGINVFQKEDFDSIELVEETSYPWGFSIIEKDVSYELKQDRRAVQDQTFFDRIPFDSHDPWDAYKYFKNSDNNLPSAIIIGDSYINGYFVDEMAESFSELVFLDRYDLPMIPLLIQQINPDIIICAGLGQESLDYYLKLERVLDHSNP